MKTAALANTRRRETSHTSYSSSELYVKKSQSQLSSIQLYCAENENRSFKDIANNNSCHRVVSSFSQQLVRTERQSPVVESLFHALARTEKQSNTNGVSLQQLARSDNIDKLLSLFQEYISQKQSYMVKHVKTLLNMADDDDEKIDVSVGALKSMLLFLLKLRDFKKPTSIELNENGTFQLRWKQDDANLATLRFQKSNRVDYVIFLPSQHEERPIVLNGNMNLFDFEELFVKRCGFTTKLLRG
jgi:hypothetical protein